MRFSVPGHKRRSAALGMLLVLAIAGGAAAYWTIGGSGTGTATAGTVTAITVNQTSTVTGLYPGQAPVALAGTFTNTNSGPVYVSSVTAAVRAFSIPGTGGRPACTEADFAIGGTATVGTEIPSGSGVGSWSGLTVQLLNLATNQDACKNASITIDYTANP